MNNIEFEYKIIISHNEYENLLHTLKKTYKSSSYTQKNIYFDTQANTLKNAKSAFRIRYLNDTLEWTLKVTIDKNKKLELKQLTSSSDFNSINSEIKQQLTKLNVDINDLNILCEITTHRTDFDFHGSTLSLDHSTFINTNEDYELELEINDEKAIKHFNELLINQNIKNIAAPSKVARAMNFIKNS